MIGVVDAIFRFAASDPDASALADGRRTVTYAQLASEVADRADGFRASGARVIALSADNSPEWVMTDLAARAAGMVVVPIPAFFSPSQKLHALADSGAELVVASAPEVRALMLDVTPADKSLRGIGNCPVWWRNSVRHAADVPSDTGRISYTSGTTGRPTGVCISHSAAGAVAASLVAATASLRLARHLCLLPLPTLLENIAGNDAPLMAGANVLLPGLQEIGWTGATGLDFGRLTTLLTQLEPDSIILVPEMLRGLLGAFAAGWHAPQSLRFVAVGGGRVAPALLEQAERCGLPVYEGYGLTECASVVALNTPEGRRRGSVGRPLPHARVRVSANGEIAVAGPSVCRYLGDATHEEREFATGDIGTVDDDGFLYIHGRSRNVFINSFGRNVSPDWVEPEFLRHGVIRQIVIFGEARPWNIAVIVAAPKATAAEVESAVRATNAGLPDYAQVGDWMVADEAFGQLNGFLTGNGRVRRDAVFAAYRERIESRYHSANGRRVAG